MRASGVQGPWARAVLLHWDMKGQQGKDAPQVPVTLLWGTLPTATFKSSVIFF
jgi:hypothetical protein